MPDGTDRKVDRGGGKRREVVSYNGVHNRLVRERGDASAHPCGMDCGRQAKHWAYDYSDPEPLMSKIGLPYSLDLSNYWPLCPNCHYRSDKEIA